MFAGPNFLSRIARTAAGLALLGVASVAQAYTIDSSSYAFQSFTVTWSLLDGQTDPNGNTNDTGTDLTGSAAFVFTGFDVDTNQVTFELTLENTTAPNTMDIGLQKFGMGTTPNLTVVSWAQISNGDTDKVVSVADLSNSDSELDNAVAPGNQTLIDVVTATNPGGSSTLLAGEKDTFKLVLELALGESFDIDAPKSIVFTPFAVKYQTKEGSFEFAGHGNGGGGPSGGVPLPGTLALLGIGVLAARRVARRPR